MKHKNIFNFLSVIVILLLAACSAKEETIQETAFYEEAMEEAAFDYSYAAEYDMTDSAEAPAAVYAKSTGSGSVENGSAPQSRMIRKSASLSITVIDPLQVMEEISHITEEMGGFVVSSSTSSEYYNSTISLPHGNMTIRIPSDRLTEMLDTIEGFTSDKTKYVKNKYIYGEDITSEYVDSQSRLTSLQKTLDKLYEILETAEDASTTLEIYNSISSVEMDMEVMEGQIKYMEESVAFSSVDISISSIRPEPIQTVSRWDIKEIVRNASESLVNAGKTILEILIYLVIVVLPIILIIGIPVYFIVKAVKKNRAKKSIDKKSE